MSRAKTRGAPTVPVPQSDEGAARQLADLGAAMRAREAIAGRADARIAEIQAQAAEAAAPLTATTGALVEGLRVWAEANRDRLAGRGKTIRLTTGTLAWRQRPPSVRIAQGMRDAVLRQLDNLGLERFLRRKVDLDREAMLREAEMLTELLPDVEIGSEGEDFVAEPTSLEGVS